MRNRFIHKKYTMRTTPFRSRTFLFGSAGSGTRRHAHRLQISAFPFRSSLCFSIPLSAPSAQFCRVSFAFISFFVIKRKTELCNFAAFFLVHCVSVLRLICILPISSRISPAFYPVFNFPEPFETQEIPKKRMSPPNGTSFPVPSILCRRQGKY